MAALESLDAAITQRVASVLSGARACPVGGGPSWDALLASWAVTPLDAGERATIASCMRLQRGAVPAGVRSVLQSVARWARSELERLRADAAFVDAAAADRLERRLDELADHETAVYERALGPVAAPTLASIFANAQRTSKDGPHARHPARVVTLTCVRCGAPQQEPLDFLCKYCRRPIAGATAKATSPEGES